MTDGSVLEYGDTAPVDPSTECNIQSNIADKTTLMIILQTVKFH